MNKTSAPLKVKYFALYLKLHKTGNITHAINITDNKPKISPLLKKNKIIAKNNKPNVVDIKTILFSIIFKFNISMPNNYVPPYNRELK